MKPKRLLVISISILGLLIAAGSWNFVIRPRSLFVTGMTHEQIETAVGKGCDLIPAAHALSAPPTAEEKAGVPMYLVRLPAYGVKLYLNSYKRVIFVDFALGPDRGALHTFFPKSRTP